MFCLVDLPMSCMCRVNILMCALVSPVFPVVQSDEPQDPLTELREKCSKSSCAKAHEEYKVLFFVSCFVVKALSLESIRRAGEKKLRVLSLLVRVPQVMSFGTISRMCTQL